MICYLHLTPKQFPCRMPYQCITRQESRICYVLPDCVTSTGLRFDWIIIYPPLGLYLHTNQRKCKVNIWISQNTRGQHITTLQQEIWQRDRVAKVGSLSLKAKLPTKIFVRHVFAIFATNALFWRIIANLQIQFSIFISKKCHVIRHFLPTEHCFE